MILLLRLRIEERFQGGTNPAWGPTKRPIICIELSSKALDRPDVILHELGHMYSRHYRTGGASKYLNKIGDLQGYMSRELQASYEGFRNHKTLEFFGAEVADLIDGTTWSFRVDPEEVYRASEKAFRDLGIPFRYLKEARRILEETGLLSR